jgi:hypothetical protein
MATRFDVTSQISVLCLSLLLVGCGVAAITDRYGNPYGDWYNPGSNYRWQLDACEQQMAQQSIPDLQRRRAMRCCMRDHGVPIDDPEKCRI